MSDHEKDYDKGELTAPGGDAPNCPHQPSMVIRFRDKNPGSHVDPVKGNWLEDQGEPLTFKVLKDRLLCKAQTVERDYTKGPIKFVDHDLKALDSIEAGDAVHFKCEEHIKDNLEYQRFLGRLNRQNFTKLSTGKVGEDCSVGDLLVGGVSRGTPRKNKIMIASTPTGFTSPYKKLCKEVEDNIANAMGVPRKFLGKATSCAQDDGTWVINKTKGLQMSNKGREKGEKDMTVKSLLDLANVKANDDLTNFGSKLPANIRKALEEELADEADVAARSAAKEIVNLLKASEVIADSEVVNIRSLRRRAKVKKANLVQLERAKQYGLETNNFIPLALLCGAATIFEVTHNMEGKAEQLLNIPKDWEPGSNTEDSTKSNIDSIDTILD